MESRNTTEGFAIRTLKNLNYIKEAWEKDRDEVNGPHVVAQLGNSLLGLVVMPREDKKEKKLNAAMKKLKLHIAESEWCSIWDIKQDTYEKKTKTLFVLITHLRNAAAHRRIVFSSDKRELSEVTFAFEDQHEEKAKGIIENWRAEIGGLELHRFCCKFAEFIQKSV